MTTCLDNVCRLWCESESISPSLGNTTNTEEELDVDSLLRNNLYNTLKFQLDAIIDPADFPTTVVSNINPDVIAGSPVVAYSPPFPDLPSRVESPGYTEHRSSCQLHFLNSRELFLAVAGRETAESEFMALRREPGSKSVAEIVKKRNQQLSDTFNEYPDVLFHVNEEGSIVFWGIQVNYSARVNFRILYPLRSAQHV